LSGGQILARAGTLWSPKSWCMKSHPPGGFKNKGQARKKKKSRKRLSKAKKSGATTSEQTGRKRHFDHEDGRQSLTLPELIENRVTYPSRILQRGSLPWQVGVLKRVLSTNWHARYAEATALPLTNFVCATSPRASSTPACTFCETALMSLTP
jgi:hypothetical protein